MITDLRWHARANGGQMLQFKKCDVEKFYTEARFVDVTDWQDVPTVRLRL
jgi:hypothetical protein